MEYFGAQKRLVLCFSSLSPVALCFSSVSQDDPVRLGHAASLLTVAWAEPRERRLPWGMC